MTAAPPFDSRAASAAAHRGLPHANPLSTIQMNALVTAALTAAPRTAIDIGCGPGAFALALAERAVVTVTAIDINPGFLARARADAHRRTLRGNVTFVEAPAAEQGGGPFDLAVCLGASQAFGLPRAALAALARLVPVGGTVVYGDLVWTARPASAFLAFLDADEDFTWPVEDGASALAACGLRVEREEHASRSDWERYESTLRETRRTYAATLPAVQGEALLAHADAWKRAYDAHGRACLGFSAYVARRVGDGS